eukprot:TRINITY_DN2376_c0_g1_i2.p1 TRINITY_DN2376_c0_g1~~TRINITY_DN2376_c0_g1_i2.p1  ORF type:complete len:536 (-),score=111.72 TRINITY_DN2376_c0_g1_i2:324-1931(-)
MKPTTRQKILDILHKDFTSLPVCIDLPRLINFMKVYKNGILVSGTEEQKGPNWPITKKLFQLVVTLAEEINGTEVKKKVSDRFFDYVELHNPHSLSRTLEKFFSEILGSESYVLSILKSCNQSAIAPAIVELKMALGMEHMTKDVKNSWRFQISINSGIQELNSESRELSSDMQGLKAKNGVLCKEIEVRTFKQEIHVQNLFQFEWTLRFIFDCESGDYSRIDLEIIDLMFHEDVHKGDKGNTKSQVIDIIRSYTKDEVLKASETRHWEFFPLKKDKENKTGTHSPGLIKNVVGSLKLKRTTIKVDPIDNRSTGGPVFKLSHSAEDLTSKSPSEQHEKNDRDPVKNKQGIPLTSRISFSRAIIDGRLKLANGYFEDDEEEDRRVSLLHTTRYNRSRFTFDDGTKSSSSFKSVSIGNQSSSPNRAEFIKVYKNGDRYQGSINKQCLRDGKGIYTTPDGDIYTGEYKNGLRHGRGIYSLKDGTKFEGEFAFGKPLKGTYTFDNGDTYTGTFEDELFHGKGIWNTPEGEKESEAVKES